MPRKNIAKYLNPWMFKREKKRAQFEMLRKRDGDLCWFCAEPIDFAAAPNSPTAWSIEHLIPTSRRGAKSLDNCVLCHPRCNRKLADQPLIDKIKLRDERRKVGAASTRPQ